MTKVEVKDGKAFNVTPDVELTKEEVMDIKEDLTIQIMNIDRAITKHEQMLVEAKEKLAECEAICTELGY